MKDDQGNKSTRGSSGAKEGFGDDQGTRVGKPDGASESARTGAGSEASEGVHGAEGRSEENRTSLEDRGTGRGGDGERDRSASEPLTGRTREHQSGYGGAGGEPRSGSQERELSAPGESKTKDGMVGDVRKDENAGRGIGRDKDAVGG